MDNRQTCSLTILHLSAVDRPVGPGKQILQQSIRLPVHGLRPVIAGFSVRAGETEFLAGARELGLTTACVRSLTGWDPRAITRLVRLMRRYRCSVLITHGYKADLVGLAAARLTTTPIIAYSRGWTGENRRVRLYERLSRLVLPCMDRIVAVSKAKREELLSLGLRPGSVVTIPNAVDVPEPLPSRPEARFRLLRAFSLSPDVKLVATAGRLSPEKAQGDFLRAYSQLALARPETRALVFGDGPERGRLEALCRELNIAARVTFCGHRTEFIELLPGVDLFVLSSLTEGLPNVVLEAFAVGVPVVATLVGGVPEIARDGITALLAPPAQPTQLASAMLEALSDEAASARRAAAARALVKERHGFADNARHLAELIHQVAARAQTFGEARVE